MPNTSLGGVVSSMADRVLEWAKMVDRRIWDWAHPLRHFCYPPTWMAGKTASLEQREGGTLKGMWCEN